VAVASRTNKGAWARKLLKEFQIERRDSKAGKITLAELMPYQEIYSSDKTRHFEALRKQTGVRSLLVVLRPHTLVA
jgi:hypothetical protein